MGLPSRRPGASDVGYMWGLHLVFLSGVGGGKEEEKERRREVDLRLNSNNPNLKGRELILLPTMASPPPPPIKP